MKPIAYEETLLNLIERVTKLEKQVAALQGTTEPTTPVADSDASTVENKEGVISYLKHLAPSLQIEKLRTSAGGGLEISGPHHRLHVMLKMSRNYTRPDIDDGMTWRSWHTLALADINRPTNGFDAFMFTTKTDVPEAPLAVCILSKSQLEALLPDKTPSGKNQLYHFYIGETTAGQTIESRDDDAAPVDWQTFRDQWQLF